MPYLRYARREPEGIGALLRGLIARHVESVLQDPYANSFAFSAADMACKPPGCTTGPDPGPDPSPAP